MKLIESKAEYIPQEEGLEGIYKQIELCGRTCYKSENKITESSAKPFVDRMIKSKHLAMLEHGTVYLAIPAKDDMCLILGMNPYTKGNLKDDIYYFSTNLRVLVEHKALWVLDKYLCGPTENHEKRYTLKVTTSIGVTREFNRHRVNSIAEQSTRYCNYSKDKFGNEVAFCIPSWLSNVKEGSYTWKDYFGDWRHIDKSSPSEDRFIAELFASEKTYLELLEIGWQPQQAREVLPLCTATEAVYTVFESDWKYFFGFRYFEITGKVHPNMFNLTQKMQKAMQEAGIWEDIMSKPSKFE